MLNSGCHFSEYAGRRAWRCLLLAVVALACGGGVRGEVYDLEEVGEPGSVYRWVDVAGNVYAASFRSSYSYDSARVTVDLSPHGRLLRGVLSATGLKPNFAYQIKLVGIPGTETNEILGFAGRWWQEVWNGSAWASGWNLNSKGDGSFPNPNDLDYLSRRDVVSATSPTGRLYRFSAYVVLAYFVTDSEGEGAASFAGDSSYHVLWTAEQRPQVADDGPLVTASVRPEPAHPAYDVGGEETTVSVFGEWERLPVGGVFLGDGTYDCRILLTEESFHGMGGTYAGFWAPALSKAVAFTVDRTPPAVQAEWESPWAVSISFSEEVNGAEDPDSYVFLPGLAVHDVLPNGDGSYRLLTEPQMPGVAYALSVSGVRDAAGNVTGGAQVLVPQGTFITASSLEQAGEPHLFLGTSSRATDGFDAGLDVLSDGSSPVELVSSADPSGAVVVSDFRPEGVPVTRWRLWVSGEAELGDVLGLIWQVGGIPSTMSAVLQRLRGETPVDGPLDLMSALGAPLYLETGESYEVCIGIPQVTTLELLPGWNLVGVSVMTLATLGDVLSQGGADLRAGVPAWAWEGTHYEGVGEDGWLNPERAYWLWHAGRERVVLRVEGMPADGRMSLRPGWNLVSPPTPTLVETLCARVSDAWRWSGLEKRYKLLSPGTTLNPGHGYWIHVPVARGKER